jgi:hypothetical protein
VLELEMPLTTPKQEILPDRHSRPWSPRIPTSRQAPMPSRVRLSSNLQPRQASITTTTTNPPEINQHIRASRKRASPFVPVRTGLPKFNLHLLADKTHLCATTF